jgi:murein DD-endopeptidase MepM/ murein hydrolase activator NlpD
MHICQRLTALTLIIILAGCSRSLPPAEVVFEKTTPTAYHVVKTGESLVTIANQYGMDKNELTRLNGLRPPYRLVTGQRLLVIQHGTPINQQPTSEGTYETGGVTVQTLQPLPGVGAVPSETPPSAMLEEKKAEEQEAGEEETPSDEKQADSDVATKPIPASAGQMLWPVQGKIIKDFSSNGEKRGNDGINIAAPKGTPVKAADNGVVARSGNQLRGFGNFILIKHASGLMTVYTHLDTIAVKDNETVQRGQTIGSVGVTGQVKEPQVHFEVRRGKTPIDPRPLLQ